MTLDLPFVWAVLIAFAVLAYVVLDGFDLGIGILFPLLARGEQRDMAMNSIAPVWDGNETWLVLGGGGLLATFPLAYAVALTAFYPLVIAMLLGLVLRGVAFEFRGRTERGKPVWEWGFFSGSLAAALAQGLMLGALVQGVRVEHGIYAGGWFDWLTPFSLLTSLAVVIGYALLGACWLNWKTVGEAQAFAVRAARALVLPMLAGIGAVSLWTPFLNAQFLARWFSWPAVLYVAPVPLLTLAAAAGMWIALREGKELAPFLATLALFVLCYVGLGISLYPEIVPPSVTIRNAASPDASLGFLLAGAALLVPIILGYTAYSYWVFRGKVRAGEGYHH